ncbi:hypothetical protein MSPGM_12140 [Methylorubrum sp. GM97]|nr:hypothetical protein MSPGM_12140 [Methylorubrum sp. GM97]
MHLEAVRWEERFYSAHDSFQPQILRSIECDLVVAILRGRLGSPLSEAFHTALPPQERLPDGASYPSGTAYEILSAIRQRQHGGELPDIYVFRWPEPPQISLDAPERAEIEAQWQALKRFAEAVFLTPEGQFKGAYQSYRSLDDFEAQVEALLRDWLKAHVLGEHTVLWPAERGSPFRGLEPFGMRHSEVFFGRTREVSRAVDKLKLVAGQGTPFQLVVGPSGAGKSSFVRAGLVPKLIAPGEVEGVSVWRVALMRPGESPDGPIAALARRLFESSAEIHPAEAGRPAALPELSMGAFATPEALALLLAHADETSSAPILTSLAKIAGAEQKKWGAERSLPARLLLVVDQLDEIFATAITDAQRVQFGRLLEVLERTGAVWVVATLRAEFYETFLKSSLAVLAGDERTFTLKPPGLAEIAEIVREPARVAHLTWESDPQTGERLDERLLIDVDRPDLLPLLQFVLDRLYEKREGGFEGQPLRLTFAAYRALDTLDGALDTVGRQALDTLSVDEQARLPRLLRALVTPAATGGATTLALQSVPLARAAPDEESRRLAGALVDARILVTNVNEQGEPLISLAHQRVIEAWEQARTIIAASAGFYRVQGDITAQRSRWESGKRRGELLIPRGVSLAEAEQLTEAHPDECLGEDIAFVRASRRRANRAVTLFASLAAVFAIVTVFSAIQWKNASEAKAEAEQQTDLANKQKIRAQEAELQAKIRKDEAEYRLQSSRKVIENVIDNVVFNMKGKRDINLNTLRNILESVEHSASDLEKSSPEDLNVKISKGKMLRSFGELYADLGKFELACDYFSRYSNIAELLRKRYTQVSAPQRDYVESLVQLGWCKEMSGSLDEASDLIERSKKNLLDLEKEFKDIDADKMLFAEVLSRSANIRREKGDYKGAASDYEEILKIQRDASVEKQLNPTEKYNFSLVLGRAAWGRLLNRNYNEAYQVAQEQSNILKHLTEIEPDNLTFLSSYAESFGMLARIESARHDYASAIFAINKQIGIASDLMITNKENPDIISALSSAYYIKSAAELDSGLEQEALGSIYRAIETVSSHLQSNSSNFRMMELKCLYLKRRAQIEHKLNYLEKSSEAYREIVEIRKKLTQANPNDRNLQTELSAAIVDFQKYNMAK